MVSEHDRQAMLRLARDLAASETDAQGTPEQRAEVLALINADRVRDGAEPLADRAPEEGFYDRAKSLGMARISGDRVPECALIGGCPPLSSAVAVAGLEDDDVVAVDEVDDAVFLVDAARPRACERVA